VYTTFTLIISVVSLALSGYAVFRSPLIGPQGPAGKDGKDGAVGVAGPRGFPGPPASGSSEHTVCGQCGKTVARFSLTANGPVCANCCPLT
jgi:hypothetical protein